jgi:hypothetical protein
MIVLFSILLFSKSDCLLVLYYFYLPILIASTRRVQWNTLTLADTTNLRVCLSLTCGIGLPLFVRTSLNKYWFRKGVKLNILILRRWLMHNTVLLTFWSLLVTWCTNRFNIQQLYALPTLYLCVLYLSEKKQRLVPLTT